MAAQGRSLLLSAYTNAALDNMLLKLVDAGHTDLLRLGRPDAVHPRLQPYTLTGGDNPPRTALAVREHVRSLLRPFFAQHDVLKHLQQGSPWIHSQGDTT